MWHGSIGEMNAIEHRIDLLPNKKSIAQHPKKTELRAPEEDHF